MTLAISIGQKFGSLTVNSIHGRGSGKTRLVKCLCDCGRPYDAEAGQLFHGITSRCRNCANPKWYGEVESHIRAQYVNYRSGAARRGYDHQLTIDEFRGIYLSDCTYCGQSPAKGIDRRDNTQGYLVKNCAPCCKHCNLAKRDMTETDFLAWVARIAVKQGFSL